MKIIIYIIFFLSIINFNNLTYADGKIVYLNVNYVFSNSVPGKNANKSFDKKIKTLESDVNNFKKNINDEKDKLIKKKIFYLKIFLIKNLLILKIKSKNLIRILQSEIKKLLTLEKRLD